MSDYQDVCEPVWTDNWCQGTVICRNHTRIPNNLKIKYCFADSMNDLDSCAVVFQLLNDPIFEDYFITHLSPNHF